MLAYLTGKAYCVHAWQMLSRQTESNAARKSMKFIFVDKLFSMQPSTIFLSAKSWFVHDLFLQNLHWLSWRRFFMHLLSLCKITI